jgi:L-galactose dehydrogenase/L-glyceraldehyde 3-phosphate reductase
VLGDVVEAFQRLQTQGKVRYFGITALGETTALHEVIDSAALYTAQVCYNLLNPSAGQPVPAGFPSQDFGQLIDRAAAKRMGCIGIRVLVDAGYAASLVEAAMRFAWSKPEMSTVLVGYSSLDHLEHAIAAAERGALPAAAMRRLTQAWEAFAK